ncbi:11313_t:CDS:2 [Funneliformis geosporum]|uniref:11313_t:CDS:1 n=1 Tax=Funneliformis geosporum TaxID=1117311 RepID=A0A9W4SFK2_9GLOM|nr:11313_t:CDS:2 [Funneliformis geosporum]
MGNHLEKPEEILKGIEASHFVKKLRKAIIKDNHGVCQRESQSRVILDNRIRLKPVEELMHSYYRFIWNSNFSSPVEQKLQSGANVLDLECGFGQWLIDLCNEYQACDYVGIDYEGNFQSQNNVPKNLKFRKHNILNGIPYEDNTFDFIHMQIMMNSFTDAEWKTLIVPEIFRVCKPGGWIEIMDSDYEVFNIGPKTGFYYQMFLSVIDINQNRSSNLNQLQDIMNGYQELGFTIIKEKISAWYPIHPQNSDETFEIVPEILNSLYPFMSNSSEFKINRADYTKLSQQIIKEIADNKSYSKTYRMITQKHL